MTGETVDEVVLAAVGLVGYDHDVAALRECGVPIAPLLGEELVDGGEDHSTGGHRKEFPQMSPTLSLDRRLP
ncbi:MAG: hypothetical protein BWY79_01893 [Actinobacteria bacterium ADurb.Bin444]|nr:MAG: hypothetical protein BWY79_01893 [Actinobacteria bacterium ADurb.Bin444]